jgi:hypothetical protein
VFTVLVLGLIGLAGGWFACLRSLTDAERDRHAECVQQFAHEFPKAASELPLDKFL